MRCLLARIRPFALVAGEHVLEPGDGAGQLERALDALAHVDFSIDAPAPAPPIDPSACILVSVEGRSGFGDALVVGTDARLRREEVAA